MNKEIFKIVMLNTNKKNLYVSENLKIKIGNYVIVETEKGIEFGKVCGQIIDIGNLKKTKEYKKIVRVANAKDIKIYNNNKDSALKALYNARKISKNMNLNMNLISSYYTQDKTQLVFNFISEDRVDFRELAKKLATIYKTRIELRQIGVRDKAKEIGGLGPCGRFLCCNLFLNEFASVSINMAKNQYLSLKPDKINGICGRLLCCLNYEDEQYNLEKQKYPLIGTIKQVNSQKVKVIEQKLFKDSVVVELPDKTTSIMKLEEYESSK